MGRNIRANQYNLDVHFSHRGWIIVASEVNSGSMIFFFKLITSYLV